ncbi:MAG: T9SS type A sorting domain-containing protein [Saprospiraceae bacterium]|nr:T9SS type A sorting domain-containing protein [Saprospiraceae bacterium]
MKKTTLSSLLILNAILAFTQSYPVITRLEGVGAGENFLELADGEYDKMFANATYGEVIYKPGKAPISVQIVNPLDVKEGTYFITFVDPTPNDTLSLNTRWILLNENGDTLAVADYPISQYNEQFISDLGISIRINQSDDAGDQRDISNGTIGFSLTYGDTSQPQWLTFISDDFGNTPFTNFIQTEMPSYPDYIFDPDRAYSTFAPWVPFILTDTGQDEPAENPFGWIITPGWLDPSGDLIQTPQFGGVLQSLNNIDIILTSDTNKWSRCVVVETANFFHTGPDIGLETEGNKKNLQARSRPSVGKRDNDNDGFPDPDGANDANGNPLTGMGWFPGYAVDLETGDRLNIFFGENSAYGDFVGNQTVAEILGLGHEAYDMIWNPGKQIILSGSEVTPLEAFAGGQQYVYVARTKYDGCSELRKDIDRTGIIKARALAKVTWCAIPLTMDDPNIELLPLNEGLIPNDVTIKLRVDNPYQLKEGNGQYNDYPTYRFKLEGTTAIEDAASEKSSFNLYPNPATNTVSIEGTSYWIGETSIRLFNTNGILMLENTFQNQDKMVIDLRTLAPGMYFVEIRNGSGRETKKIVVE